MAAKSSNLALRFKAKEEFNNHRCIQLINLPPSTEGELQEFLGNFRAKKIKINDSLDSALVVLENGNQIDEAVEKLNNKEFKDNTVTVKYGFSNQLICIAHIPLSYTESQFKDMCEKYGTVEYSYIMRTEDTGDGKGYGFVEFAIDIEQAKLIKSEFDWKNVDGQILHADFVEEHGQSWERLQSRCLLINNMPENFVDVSKLREMFGVITSPVYCQIIAKGDRSLGYGIVEFRTAEDAEKTWFKLKDEKIQGKDLILTFCIPGKSAVVINNRIMWKFGDKLTKSTSLLPDPVSAKPVIAGNPIVISLSKFNPSLMDEFAKVLNELQQAYVSQMMSPVNKPGLLGPAPSLPLSPMMNPNMQLGLLVMLAIHIQAAKKEQFIGVLAKQLNTLSELDVISDFKGPKPSILGDPLTGQANVILTSLKQQLNQVPLTEDGKELKEPDALYDKINYIVKKFIANGRYLNLSLLNNLGQLLVTMKQVDIGGRTATGMKGQSLLGPVPGILPQPLLGSNKSTSLLGDPPSIGPLSNLGSANVNTSIMQAIGLNVGSSNTVGNVGQSLLSQISQGLVHQIEQNLLYQMSVGQTNQNNSSQNTSGRGLLGDIPSNVPKNKNVSTSKSSLLGEPPAHLKAVHSSMPPTSQLEQNAWKGMGNKKNVETNFDMMNNSDRWGTGAYESGYNNKVRPNQGYNYSCNDTYTDVTSGYGGYNETGSDFYNYQSYCYNAQQVEQFYQTDGSCNSQFGSSNYGSGGGSSGLSGPGNGYGSGQNSNQASGVNFQDGQTFVKGGISGLGQDNTKCIGDNYNMGMGNYGYGNRDELGNGFDSYGSVMGSYSTSTDNVVGATGTGNIGGTGLLNSSGGSQGILGSGPVSSGGGNNLLGTGRGDGLYGTVGASSGLLGSGAGYYGTGTFMGSGSGVGMSSNLSDSMSTYNAGLGMNAAGKNNFGMGLLGSGSNVSSGNMTNRMSGISNRDSANSSTYYTGTSSTLSSGLLPSPSKHATPVGQKRSHTQLLPKPEQSPDGSDYIGQHSQGLGGHYLDSFKKSRLF